MLKLPDKEESYWRAGAPKTKYPALRKDLQVDVAIVGGGIAGLTAAYVLKKAGHSVAVIEKDFIGSGTTGNTTGKVTSQHNLTYSDLSERLGDKTARLYGQANEAAIEIMEKIIKKEEIDCGWTRADNYVYTADHGQVKRFQEEAKTAVKLGLPASFETKSPLPFEIKAAVGFKNQAKMDAQKYILGLAKAVDGSGSFVFENSRAISFRDGVPGRVKTKEATVTATDIIVATNVPSFPLLARGTYCVFEYPHMSYIVAGRINKPLKGMYISPDKNHYSILPVNMGKESLLLIGGENHIPGLGLGSRRHYQRLADYAARQFGITEIAYRWKARDYLSYDELPLVGKLYPWSRHLYTVTAFRKWGLTNSMVAATVLTNLVNGKKTDLTEAFYPHRPGLVSSIPHAIVK